MNTTRQMNTTQTAQLTALVRAIPTETLLRALASAFLATAEDSLVPRTRQALGCTASTLALAATLFSKQNSRTN